MNHLLYLPAAAYFANRMMLFSNLYASELSERVSQITDQDFINRGFRLRVVRYATAVSEFHRFSERSETRELRRIMLLASFFGITYDALFDHGPLDLVLFVGRIFHNEHTKPRTSLEEMLADIFTEIQDHAPRATNPGLYETLRTLHLLELQTHQQKKDLLQAWPMDQRREFLRGLSEEKGSAAALVFAYLAKPGIQDPCLIADIRLLGRYLQIYDDMLDVYEDHEAGIATPITEEFVSEEKIEDLFKTSMRILEARLAASPTKRFFLYGFERRYRIAREYVQNYRQGKPPWKNPFKKFL